MAAAGAGAVPDGLVVLGDGAGVVFCCRREAQGEALQLFHEVFVRAEYLRGGVSISPDATVVDVGANIGLFSLFCMEQGAGRVVAIEPSSVSADLLERNCVHRSITLRREAVGRSEGVVPLTCFPDAPGESTLLPAERASQRLRLREAAREYVQAHASGPMARAADSLGAFLQAPEADVQQEEVRLTTLSTVIAAEGLRQVDLVKVDCEGMELEVLLGVEAHHFPLIRQIVVEVHDVDGRLERVCELLAAQEYVLSVARQCTSLDGGGGVGGGGYFAFLPTALRLFYVYARRAP